MNEGSEGSEGSEESEQHDWSAWGGRDPLDVFREVTLLQRDRIPPLPDGYTEKIIADVRRIVRRRRRRRRQAIAGAIVVAAGAAGGAVTWAVTRHERAADPTMIDCRQAADTRASAIVVAHDGSDPVAQCTRAWTQLEAEWGPPPPMVACVSPTGIPAVYPGDGEATCAELGLPPLDTTLTDEDRRVLRLFDELPEIIAAGCTSTDDAVAIAHRKLDEIGLDGWKVRVEQESTAEAPCAATGFDVPARAVYFGAMEPFTDTAGG